MIAGSGAARPGPGASSASRDRRRSRCGASGGGGSRCGASRARAAATVPASRAGRPPRAAAAPSRAARPAARRPAARPGRTPTGDHDRRQAGDVPRRRVRARTARRPPCSPPRARPAQATAARRRAGQRRGDQHVVAVGDEPGCIRSRHAARSPSRTSRARAPGARARCAAGCAAAASTRPARPLRRPGRRRRTRSRGRGHRGSSGNRAPLVPRRGLPKRARGRRRSGLRGRRVRHDAGDRTAQRDARCAAGRRGPACAGVRPASTAKPEGRVGHRGGEDAVLGQAEPVVGADTGRHHAAARLEPTRPQQAAGMRTEPRPSLPCAIGTSPAATAAAAPPDEPPGVRSVRHGLRVIAVASSVSAQMPSSGIRVMPTTIAPAPRSRRTTSWSCSATGVRAAAEPFQVGRPATAVFSLTATGTPASGRLARSSWSSTVSASAIASPARITRNAPTIRSYERDRSRWSATTWVADVSPRRTARAICFAVAPTQVVGVAHGHPWSATCAGQCVRCALRDGASRQPSACSRSASRSSIVSMPTDSRTRSAGTSKRRAGDARVRHLCPGARSATRRRRATRRARRASPGCRSRPRPLPAADGAEADHAAEPAHLLGGDLVARVARAGPGRGPDATARCWVR